MQDYYGHALYRKTNHIKGLLQGDECPDVAWSGKRKLSNGSVGTRVCILVDVMCDTVTKRHTLQANDSRSAWMGHGLFFFQRERTWLTDESGIFVHRRPSKQLIQGLSRPPKNIVSYASLSIPYYLVKANSCFLKCGVEVPTPVLALLNRRESV